MAWGAYFRGDGSCSLMSEGKRVMLAPSDCLLALVCTTKGEDKSSLGDANEDRRDRSLSSAMSSHKIHW